MGFIFPNGAKATDVDYEWKSFYNGTVIQKYWKQWIGRQVIWMVDDASDKHIIDIGCGSSPVGMMIESKNYVGVDINPDKINYMSNVFRDYHANFFCRSATNLDIFNKELFDIALMIEVIEHFNSYKEAGTAISEITRIMKPKGMFIIATPNFRSPTGVAMNKAYEILYPNAYPHEHNIRFGIDSLKVLCASHGLKLEKTKSLFGADMVCCFRKES